MGHEIDIEVPGYPPAKSEAKSMLGAGHRHSSRVVRLLEEAKRAVSAAGLEAFGHRAVHLDVVEATPDDGARSDATNWLGGIADVLQNKGRARNIDLDHLGDLAAVGVFEDDRQIESISYRWELADEPSYGLSIRPLHPERHGSQDFTRQGLEQEGFSGFSSFQELGASRLSEVPAKAGVYVVLIGPGTSPQFLPESVGGHFKGRDPTEAPARLSDEWVDGAEALYIGKAKHLRRRLREFVAYGVGKPVGHQGGRLIWQLENSRDLMVAWKATQRDPETVEHSMLERFCALYGGRLPFANLRR